MHQRGDICELTIGATGFEGKSIARLDGMVVFVEGAVAGDVVRAEILRLKKKHLEARILEILEPSPQRTTPRCKYFGTCGGCQWQHVRYEEQLAFKQQHVVDAMERIGGFTDVAILPIVGSDELYFYRNKLEFSFGDNPWLEIPPSSTSVDRSGSRGEIVLGFHIPRRYDKILDVDECHLQSNLSNEVLRFGKKFAIEEKLTVYNSEKETGYLRNLVIREGKNTGDVMVNLVTFEDRPDVMKKFTGKLVQAFPEIVTVVNNINTRKAQVAVGEVEKVYYGNGVITDRIGKYVFHISANSFFQTNTRQAERLYSIVKEFAGLQPEDTVYDLYCGTGTIALLISDSVKHVMGIDIVEDSIANARVNAELNGVTNCRFIAGDLKDLLTKDVEWKSEHAATLIIDPPRSGIHPKTVEMLGGMSVPRVVYVSCNPATLARDLSMLVPFGYAIERIQPLDMFPHTFHIESVANLHLR